MHVASLSHRSLWLDQVLPYSDPQPPLTGGKNRADVAIVGGGYVGLWTAIRIKRQAPDCDVAILEAGSCGSGASGRNGGQAHTWWSVLGALIGICGAEEALRLGHASEAALDELGSLDEADPEGFHYRRDGWLWTATTPAQVGAWDAVLELCHRHGVSPYRSLDREELIARTGSRVHLAGIAEDRAGTVQPALLVSALRRQALAVGVRVYEHSPVQRMERAGVPSLHTPGGSISADRVVMATNAWAAALPELRRRLLVVSSDIVATAPIRARLDAIGWRGGEAICDSQQRVLYYQATPEGRVVFGRGGGHVSPSGRVTAAFGRQPRWTADATRAFRRIYPMLADVPIETDWSGPVDRSLTGLPMFGRLGGNERIFYGVGWSGTGVGPASVGGRILASLALGIEDEWSGCGLVEQSSEARFPPTALQAVGAPIVRAAVRSQARALEAGRTPGRVSTAVAGLVPGKRP
jgi:glycine/D-amino acid oxidase-like deaminating enzyme